MSGNIIDLDVATKLNIDPCRMLKAISEEADIQQVAVVVFRKSGKLTYHSSTANMEQICFMLDCMKADTINHALLEQEEIKE